MPADDHRDSSPELARHLSRPSSFRDGNEDHVPAVLRRNASSLIPAEVTVIELEPATRKSPPSRLGLKILSGAFVVLLGGFIYLAWDRANLTKLGGGEDAPVAVNLPSLHDVRPVTPILPVQTLQPEPRILPFPTAEISPVPTPAPAITVVEEPGRIPSGKGYMMSTEDDGSDKYRVVPPPSPGR